MLETEALVLMNEDGDPAARLEVRQGRLQIALLRDASTQEVGEAALELVRGPGLVLSDQGGVVLRFGDPATRMLRP